MIVTHRCLYLLVGLTLSMSIRSLYVMCLGMTSGPSFGFPYSSGNTTAETHTEEHTI